MSTIGIYKITSPNGRVYIGQSVNIERRWVEHRSGVGEKHPKLYRSFKKYGIDNHTFEVIEECKDEKSLNEQERYYQEKYNVLEEGLNCRLTETKDRSGRLSKETKANISKARKGIAFSEEHKAKISEANRKMWSDPEYKAKMSKALSARWEDPEFKTKISKALTGKKQSEETKTKRSEALKGRKCSEEEIAKRRTGAMIACPVCGKEKYRQRAHIKRSGGEICCSKACVDIKKTTSWAKKKVKDRMKR